MRQFRSARAVRANVPLLLALIGPSGGGKTFSAMRLATGIQRVQPGPIFGIDTEGKRMCEIADRFTFQRVEFSPPFGSLDYLAAIQHCVNEGARTIVIDSMSHEHEGPGGMLESADREVEERVKRAPDQNTPRWKLEARYKMSGFIKPKADRQKLIQGILQLPCNVIMCFRAKEKIQPAAQGDEKREPKHLGWMPIGGDEFWYEMTARCLLLPGANGVPTWEGLQEGEKMAARLPEQFRSILKGQLSEDMGERMAAWASGAPPVDTEAVLARVAAAGSIDELKKVVAESKNGAWLPADRARVGLAIDARKAELKSGAVPGSTEEKK